MVPSSRVPVRKHSRDTCPRCRAPSIFYPRRVLFYEQNLLFCRAWRSSPGGRPASGELDLRGRSRDARSARREERLSDAWRRRRLKELHAAPTAANLRAYASSKQAHLTSGRPCSSLYAARFAACLLGRWARPRRPRPILLAAKSGSGALSGLLEASHAASGTEVRLALCSSDGGRCLPSR